MNTERSRQERFTRYTAMLRERFSSGILAELQPLNQWVVWRREVEEGKKKKVPYNPNYHLIRASVKIPKSWGTLHEALTALETGNYSGLGFMITPPLVMIDLDNSFNRATGTITNPLAEQIVREVNSFFEASPNKGLHGLVYVKKPIKNVHADAIEIYGQDRFTTITTDHIAGTPTTIENSTDAIQALYGQFAPPPVEINPTLLMISAKPSISRGQRCTDISKQAKRQKTETLICETVSETQEQALPPVFCYCPGVS